MRKIIQHPSTWYNLNRLCDYMNRVQLNETKVSILIDCLTGEIYIPQSINELDPKLWGRKNKCAEVSDECRHAELEIRKSERGICFHLSIKALHLADGVDLVIQETLDILNQAGKEALTGPEALRHCIRSIQMELPFEVTAHPGWWGAISRIEAERLLLRQETGTYLLREGEEETRRLEWTVQKKHLFPIRCYVMTMIEEGGKISDQVLIQSPQGWMLYQDDLDLTQRPIKTLQAAILFCSGKRPYKMVRRAA